MTGDPEDRGTSSPSSPSLGVDGDRAALHASLVELRVLLDGAADPIFSFTPEGRYLFANRAFCAGTAAASTRAPSRR